MADISKIGWRLDPQPWALDPEISNRVKVEPDSGSSVSTATRSVQTTSTSCSSPPPGCRPIHFEAAVEARKHIFCEKPFGADATGVRHFMAAAKKYGKTEADRKIGRAAALEPGIWTSTSHEERRARRIVHLYAYWVGTPVLNFNNTKLFPNKKRDPKWGDMECQHRNWYSFVWMCGDQIVEQHLHNIDVCNWIMGGHPVPVVATGGAAWRPQEDKYGNIYDQSRRISSSRRRAHVELLPAISERQPQNVSERIVGTKGVIDTATARR